MHAAGRRCPGRPAASYQAATERRPWLVLLTTHATLPYHRFALAPSDVILVGRETSGVPEAVHQAARLVIPMQPGLHSLNVALAAAMGLGEALRQTALFPGEPS
jgi:tRNA (cytidine/uridine-2'-O-)-methyltransferase